MSGAAGAVSSASVLLVQHARMSTVRPNCTRVSTLDVPVELS